MQDEIKRWRRFRSAGRDQEVAPVPVIPHVRDARIAQLICCECQYVETLNAVGEMFKTWTGPL